MRQETEAVDDTLEAIVTDLAAETKAMLDKHLPGLVANISYVAIFCTDSGEFSRLRAQLPDDAILANDTPTGPVYALSGFPTAVGKLRIVKLRLPDRTRTERGDADYAAADYSALKDQVLDTPGFSLIVRDQFEMIELIDPAFDARVYFSNPPVETHGALPDALARLDAAPAGGSN